MKTAVAIMLCREADRWEPRELRLVREVLPSLPSPLRRQLWQLIFSGRLPDLVRKRLAPGNG